MPSLVIVVKLKSGCCTVHLIRDCSKSHALQTQLIAQSHEERTKFEVSIQQVTVLCVIPYESKPAMGE